MNKYEQMKHEFLSRVKSRGAAGYNFKPHHLEQEFGIETRHVRETLIEWAKARLISLDVYIGEAFPFRTYSAWRSGEEFFEHGNKEVRAKLLAAGDEQLARLEEIKQRPIGFHAKPV